MPDAPKAQRPEPTVRGVFTKTPLAHLVVYVAERRLRGSIELFAPENETARLSLIDGRIGKIWTSQPVAYLGRVLADLGMIDDGTLNATLVRVAKEKRLHGQILLDSAAIGPEQLREGLRAQLARKLAHLFSLPPETSYAFYDGHDLLANFGASDTPTLDPLPAVWNGVCQSPPWEHVHNALKRLGDRPVALSPRASLGRFGFQPDELAAANLLGEPARAADLTQWGVLPPRTTQLLVYVLLITKQIDVVDIGAVPRATTSIRMETMSARMEAVDPSRSGISSADSVPVPSVRTPISSQRPPPPSITPPPPSITPPPPSTGPASGRISSGRITGDFVAAPPSGEFAVRSDLHPDLAARRQQIIDRAKGLDQETFFQLLGVSEDAKPDAIQAAFFAAAKQWHPDRVPAAISEVRPACAKVFARLNEAQQALTDPAKRQLYLEQVRSGKPQVDEQAIVQAVLEAFTLFQKAEISLRRGDAAQAEELCRKAHELDPEQADYLALLTWLEAAKPENQGPRPTLEAVAKLDRAAGMAARCERAYYYRGLLHKRLNDLEAAVRDFRLVVQLNPRNVEAAREVRLFEMRKKNKSLPPPAERPQGSSEAPPSGGTGLFGKLFKR